LADIVVRMAAAAPSAPFSLPQPLTEQALVAKYFRVLGDTTRVRILELLEERGELAVGQLVALLGESQPNVSNHLACLRWCGFVTARREHPQVRYRVADPRVADLLQLGRELLAENAEHVDACHRVDGGAS
jgi:ArsR family transcriptional regulator, cadmium/lead-responsive transcriptional repressor